MKKKELQVNESLSNYKDAQEYWVTFGGKYSDGVKELIRRWDSEWFVDLIFASQINPPLSTTEFQVWTLSKLQNDTYLIEATDDRKNPIYEKVVDYCTFKSDGVRLLCISGTILLPSEF